MAAIGGNFVHDVFFSYAWAVEKTEGPEFRDWCRAVADQIQVRLRQTFNKEDVRFDAYLDRDKAKSGQELSEELRRAAERCGVFVAMVSDYYRSPYCTDEMNWFCDRMKREGSALANHLCILRVQAVSEGAWPGRFAESNGKPFGYLDFCDTSGEPIDMTEFINKVPTPGWVEPVKRAVLEIGEKLKAIKVSLRAREQFEKSQLAPDRPVLFLEAEAQDRARWSECGSILSDAQSIVLPAQAPKPATAITAEAELRDCDGLLLLRSRAGDEILSRVSRAYRERRELSKRSTQPLPKALPWVLVDDLDEPPSEIAPFQVPRVRTSGDWPSEVKKALFGG